MSSSENSAGTADRLIDSEAEQIVLGSILREGAVSFGMVVNTGLEAAHFGVWKHQFVFTTASDLVTRGREPNLGEVADTLGVAGKLGQVDGLTGLLALEEKALRGKLVAGFARKVRRAAQHRQTYALVQEIGALIEMGASGEEICRVASRIQGVYLERSTRSGGRFGACLEQLGGYDKLLAVPENLVPWPFAGCIPGMLPGQLITVGGRPGHGKTIFACHAGLEAAQAGFRTLLVSIEMGIGEMLKRLLSMVAAVRHKELQSGKLQVAERDKVIHAGYDLDQLPLEIVSEPNTLDGIGARLMQARAEGQPYGLCIIDYLGLIDAGGKWENRTQEVSHITRSLKLMAMSNDVPMLCMAQLNRENQQRADHEPHLADLRDSGTIEQDSDVVAFVHQPGRYRSDPRLEDLADVICRKQRNGPLGTTHLVFIPDFVSFRER